MSDRNTANFDPVARSRFLANAARRLLSTAAVAVLLAAGSRAAQAAAPVMNIVAHQDDDILFMNPDVLHEIHAGSSIMTVYVTAGDAIGLGADYMVSRERAARAAYASMAGVPQTDSSWMPIQISYPGLTTIKVDRMIRTTGLAPIYLVFLRLPATSESGLAHALDANSGTFYSLRLLWQGVSPFINAIVDPHGSSDPTNLPGLTYANAFGKQDVVNTLTQLMAWFKPGIVHTQDATGHTLVPDGPFPDYWYFDIHAPDVGLPSVQIDYANSLYVSRYGTHDTLFDPSSVYVYYPSYTDGGFGIPGTPDYVPAKYYNHDHSDHFYAAVFAKAALEGYTAKYKANPTVVSYHGYNIANKPVNLNATDIAAKQAVFAAYQVYDFGAAYDFTGHYLSWTKRQYSKATLP